MDVDQYLILFRSGAVSGVDKLLTSAMKRVDNAVFDTIGDAIDPGPPYQMRIFLPGVMRMTLQ